MSNRQTTHDAFPGRRSRPGIVSLLGNILRGTFSDGMQLPVLACTVLVIAMYIEDFPYHASIAGTLALCFTIIGLYRGCASWQQELTEYQETINRAWRENLSGAASNSGHPGPGDMHPRH